MEFVVDVEVIPFHVMWDPLCFSSTLSNTPLMGLVDQEMPFLGFRVPVGTTFDFVGGHNDFFPGLFLGTSFDFATGAVSDPFTGSATVRSSSVPEPQHQTPASPGDPSAREGELSSKLVCRDICGSPSIELRLQR